MRMWKPIAQVVVAEKAKGANLCKSIGKPENLQKICLACKRIGHGQFALNLHRVQVLGERLV